MANLSGAIYLSNEDFRTLATTGTVVIGSDTLTYDPNTIYITPDVLASATEDGLMSASDKSKLDTINLSNLVTTNTAQTISGVKTFSAAPLLNNNIGLQWKNSSGTAVDVIKFTNTNTLTLNVPGGTTAINSTFKPYNSNDATWDLGLYTDSSTKARWRNLYLSGNLSDGTNSISIANIANKNNFLPLTGGTLYSTSTDILTVKRDNASGGAVITYKNKNQDINLWRVGMSADGDFGFYYSSDSGSTAVRSFTITASGNIILNNNIALQCKNSSGTAVDIMKLNSSNVLLITPPSGEVAISSMVRPGNASDGIYDLGKYTSSSDKARWRNLYLSGNLSDGTNSVSIANIVKKSAALTADQFVVGNGGADVKISVMKPVASTDSSWDLTSDTKVPTMKLISEYIQAQIQAAITTALNAPV